MSQRWVINPLPPVLIFVIHSKWQLSINIYDTFDETQTMHHDISMENEWIVMVYSENNTKIVRAWIRSSRMYW